MMTKTRRWWLDPAFVLGIVFFFFGGPLNYLSSSPKILYLGALGLCILVFYGTHQLVSHIEDSRAPKKEEFQAKIVTPPPTGNIPSPEATQEASSPKPPATSNAEPKKGEPTELPRSKTVPSQKAKSEPASPTPRAKNEEKREDDGKEQEQNKQPGPLRSQSPHAWRLTMEEVNRLAQLLSPYAKHTVAVDRGMFDGDESAKFKSDIVETFKRAGWNVGDGANSGTSRGISIYVKVTDQLSNPQLRPAGLNELLTFLNGIGIETIGYVDQSVASDEFKIRVGINPN